MQTTASHPQTMRCVVAQDGLAVCTDRPVPSAVGRQVLVRVAATSLNRADTLQRAGRYPPPPGASDILGKAKLAVHPPFVT